MEKYVANFRPDLIEDWDYKKNYVNPNEITVGSDVMIYWKCNICGHEWRTEAKNRSIHNNGCKVCSKRWNTSFNELTLLYYLKQVFDNVESGYQLDIQKLKEVDIYIPNLSLIIEYDSFYRHQEREEYDNLKSKTLLNNGYRVIRLRESGLLPIKDVINLEFETNSSSFLYKKTLRVLLDTIAKEYSLPSCIKNRVKILSMNPDRDQLNILRQVKPVEMEPNLEGEYPDLSENSWDYEKNYPFKPKHFKPKSNFKVWWKCPANSMHRWRTQINVRSKGHGCPYCAEIKVTPERSLEIKNPKLVAEWDFTKNDDHPSEVAAHSNSKYWWICSDCHSPYDKALNERMAGENCPYCAGKRVNHTNSLMANYPEIAREWHPFKNGELTPDDVTFGSSKEVYWNCNRGHEWVSPIYSRTTGNRGCKECYEEYGRKKPKIVRDKEKSLAFKAPDIASQWHPTRNNVGPEEVGRNARYEYWWLCQYCGYEWPKAPNSRRSSRCPECKEKAIIESSSK